MSFQPHLIRRNPAHGGCLSTGQRDAERAIRADHIDAIDSTSAPKFGLGIAQDPLVTSPSSQLGHRDLPLGVTSQLNVVHRLLVLLVLLVTSFSAYSQGAIEPYVEYRKRVETAQNISPLDNGLFGEQVSLYNGSTSFSVTDIDVPGNSTLPVRLSRRLAIELQPQDQVFPYDSLLRGMGNWDVDVPFLAATYHVAAGNALRCNGAYVPPLVISAKFRRGEVWQGISVNVPGRGSSSALGIQTQTPRPSGGATYKLTTSERDVFDCIPMKAGFTGEGFRMTTSSGLRYYFDVGTTRTAARLVKYVKDSNGMPYLIYLDRNRLYLLASKIEDRFGNTVQFQYNANGHPTRIWANDGREINLTYTGSRLATATSHGRTWQYAYTHIGSGMYARLSQVTQPDSSKWLYSYSDDLMPPPDPTGVPQMPWCAGYPLMLESALAVTATHPSGAVGTFNFGNRRHFRSGVHATECMQTGDPYDPEYDLLVPHFFDVMSIDSKTLSGPGLSSMTWAYTYGPHMQSLWGDQMAPPSYPCTTCTPAKTVTVTNPDNTKFRYTFGMRYYDNDGRQLKVETLRANDTVIRTEPSTYMTEVQAASQPFHGEYGSNLGGIADPASVRIRPVVSRTINQDGVNFIWQANTFDTMARPKQVTKSSTVSGNPTRTEETTYHDNLAKWVLGQVAKMVCTAPTLAPPLGCGTAGMVLFERTYDASYALPLVTKRFGKVEQSLTWDTTSLLASGQRGTAKTVADGNGNITTLTGWKRGTPQSIKYPGTPEVPSGATQTAQVNDSGWLNWVEDENGSRTCYAYDAMGRLSKITYPSESQPGVCNYTWNPTTQVFAQVGASEYGIAAGHWRQTVQTGNGVKINYFDALWRPLLTHEYDAHDAASVNATQRFNRFAYDYAGRTTFASYPSVSSTPTTGIWTEYDPLGRATSVSQDSEHGLLTTQTEYLSSFRTRVTNPRGFQTTTTQYLAYDEPTTDWPLKITHPAGAYTDIVRDVFGKPRSITRRNSTSSVSVARSYVYNAAQELCKTIEPETGSTVMSYDAAGNLAWSAAGLNLPDANKCNGGPLSYDSGRRVDRVYDARNRLTTLLFADGRGNQSWEYTPDGKPKRIVTYNEPGGTAPVENTYTYYRRGMMAAETTAQSWYTWPIEYSYDTNGHLASQVSPTFLTLSFAPNALGQPTMVRNQWGGTYAANVSYHPNGAIKQFTYGNGITHTMQQNARQLPARSTDNWGAMDYGYDYDANGNPSLITDYARGSDYSRWLGYDGLDRLINAGSCSFGGDCWHRFSYDVLDNIKSWKLAGVKDYANYYYDPASNRLTNIQNTAGASVVGFAYDVQGNLTNKNGQGYDFDHGNRLRTVYNKEFYRYDGHGRRAMSWRQPGHTIVSMYANSGQLVYQSDGSKAKSFDHVYLGGSLIASIEYRHSDWASTTKYQHTDALGSPVAVTDSAGYVIERTAWEPYGAAIGKPAYDGIGYTGHVMDAATGLVQMQQRYYDPGIGRFLSVDPVTAYDNGNMRFFNRYAYAFNNPYKFTDPDGRMPACTPNCTEAQINAYTGSQAKVIVAVPLATAAVVATGILATPAVAAGVVGRGLQAARGALTRAAGAAREKTTEVGVRATVAAQSKVATALETAGVSSTTSANLAAQVTTPAVAAEFASGALPELAGKHTPPTSVVNLAGSHVGGAVREAAIKIKDELKSNGVK
jgi:RHS repeat-associated protein